MVVLYVSYYFVVVVRRVHLPMLPSWPVVSWSQHWLCTQQILPALCQNLSWISLLLLINLLWFLAWTIESLLTGFLVSNLRAYSYSLYKSYVIFWNINQTMLFSLPNMASASFRVRPKILPMSDSALYALSQTSSLTILPSSIYFSHTDLLFELYMLHASANLHTV